MSERAQVTSVEAIELFRSDLIIFLAKARAAVEEVTDELLRTQVWLQTEKRSYWENQIRLRRRKFEQAQAELFSARLSKLAEATAAQFQAFHRAQRALQEAEAKKSVLKKWDRELENRSQPLVKQVEQLHSFLTTEMAHAVAYLAEIIKSLEAYAEAGRLGPALPTPAAEGAALPTEPPLNPPPTDHPEKR